MAGIGDRAYAQLRKEILDGVLAPGAALAEVEVAARLGISRTPLRAALSRLVTDGLAVPAGGRGVRVSPVSLDDVRDVWDLRLALEQQAARLAAQRRDPEVFAGLVADLESLPSAADDPERAEYYAVVRRLDEAVDEAVGGRHLVGALRGLRVHLVRIRRLAKDDATRLAAAALEHRGIAAAIRDGDGDLAAHATHVHLSNSLRAVLRHSPQPSRSPQAQPTQKDAP